MALRLSFNFSIIHMKDYGFLRVAGAVPVVKLASVRDNVKDICHLIDKAADKEVSVVVFPELSVTGSSCGDLFYNGLLVREAEKGIAEIAEYSKEKGIVVVVGAPVYANGRLYNCSVILRDGQIAGIVPKTGISGLQARWFASGEESSQTDEITYAGQDCLFSSHLLFSLGSALIGVGYGAETADAHLVICQSADNELVVSDHRRKILFEALSHNNTCAYIYTSAGYGESTQDMVYSGATAVWEYGSMLNENERFKTEGSLTIADIDIERLDLLRRKSSKTTYGRYDIVELGEACSTDFEKTLYRRIEPNPFLPAGEEHSRCKEVISLQTAGLMTRLNHIGCRSAIIGISGGLDSTLALLVAVMAADRLGWSRERIIGVTMPGFGTTSRTKNNAWDLMQALGITCREISIKAACEQHFSDIGHDSSIHDATYENSQARERTQILMDLANKEGGIVIGTGDLSELALGWATYNGDHMSMYGVNADVPKSLVKSLVKWTAENKFQDTDGNRSVAEILLDIVDTPISPELLPATEDGQIKQVTEDLVGPYELHDFFLYHFVRHGFSPEKIFFMARKALGAAYDDETIKKWLKTFVRRFFNQQFKRSCMPDGPKVGSVGLSPRGDWHMPSDAWSTMFLNDLE